MKIEKKKLKKISEKSWKNEISSQLQSTYFKMKNKSIKKRSSRLKSIKCHTINMKTMEICVVVEKESFHWVSLFFQCEKNALSLAPYTNDLTKQKKKKERTQETFFVVREDIKFTQCWFLCGTDEGWTLRERKKERVGNDNLKERRKVFFFFILFRGNFFLFHSSFFFRLWHQSRDRRGFSRVWDSSSEWR